MFRVSDQWFIDLRIANQSLSLSDILGIISPFQYQQSTDIPFNQSLLEEINVIESIEQVVPTMTVAYNPHSPVFQEWFPLTGMDPLLLNISKEEPDPRGPSESYFVLSYTPISESDLDPRKQPFKLKCLSSSIKNLLKGSKRSLQGDLSDAIKKLVKPSTSDVDLESTHPKLDRNWIQPGWSDMKMLKYLTSQALSEEGLGPYFSFFRSDNSFVSKSLDGLYNQSRKNQQQTTWYFADLANDNSQNRLGDPADNEDKVFIMDFELSFESFLPVSKGALGFSTTGFDWDEGEWKEDNKDLSTVRKHQTLTRKLLFSDDDFLEDFGSVDKTGNYLGRTEGFSDLTALRSGKEVIAANSQVAKLSVVLSQELTDVDIGDKIQINLVDGDIPGKLQKVNSGDWLVHTKIRSIADNSFLFKYILIRDGINPPRVQQSRFADGNKL